MRKTDYRHICWKGWLLAFVVMLTGMMPLHAQRKYTRENPLVVVVNSDFPPYEFVRIGNIPDGYNVEVVKTLLERLNIPYNIVSVEGGQINSWFERQVADLIVNPAFTVHKAPYYTSRSILDYYKVKVASSKDSPNIETAEQLRHADLILAEHDWLGQKVVTDLTGDSLRIEYMPYDEALRAIARGSNKYLLWGESQLRWKIHEMHLRDSIRVNDVTIRVGEFHFVGHDKALIDLLDDHYARMDQSGELQKIRDKWMHPERVLRHLPYTVIISIVLVSIFVFVLIFIYKTYRRRETEANRNADELQHMMQLALAQSDYAVMEYDIEAGRIVNTHGTMLPAQGVRLEQLMAHVSPEHQAMLFGMIGQLKSGKESVCAIKLKWLTYIEGADSGEWRDIHGHLLAEKDKRGKVKFIVAALKDVTDEVNEERQAKELANRFKTIFDTTLIAMSFYGKDGYLIDLNENMRRLTAYDDEGNSAFFHTTRLFDVPMFKGDFDPDSPYHLHACQHMKYADNDIDKYIEFRVLPTYDKGELLYYVVTARDVTAEREMYMNLYQKQAELIETNEKRTKYEQQLRYLLENSQMWVWRSELKTKRIVFSRTLQEDEFSQSFEEYVANLYEDQVPIAMQAFGKMEGSDANFNVTLHFKKTPVSSGPQWVYIIGIPLFDEKTGLPAGHFGVVRDVTALMEAQEQLKRETSRAEDSGKLKSVFLANMTHEIRTPLNAIVGFSDLLQIIDNPEERSEFMRIIRNNCDMLIRLIDDIIEASNMNRGPLSIEATDVDFAVAFNDICQTLAQRVQEPGVEFIVDNPYKSFCTHIDKGRLQQVITNFTTNAVKYTHEGHIKVGYRYENGGIYMYCEDTGAGIPKDKQASVFERFVKLNDFVQGTGLGLSICKNIAERCGGKIGVDSEGTGHGSTFWIWVPCECQSSEKV